LVVAKRGASVGGRGSRRAAPRVRLGDSEAAGSWAAVRVGTGRVLAPSRCGARMRLRGGVRLGV
jgi:hypothetical protein